MARGAGELFDERAALFGLQAQCLVNGTLANEEETVLGKTGAIEQLVEISKANLLAIEQVLLATAAIGATSNFDFGKWKVKEPIVVGDGERNLGEAGRGIRSKRVEEVIFAGSEKRRPLGLAECPAQGIDDVRLTAAVWPNDCCDPWGEGDGRLVGKGLEAAQSYFTES